MTQQPDARVDISNRNWTTIYILKVRLRHPTYALALREILDSLEGRGGWDGVSRYRGQPTKKRIYVSQEILDRLHIFRAHHDLPKLDDVIGEILAEFVETQEIEIPGDEYLRNRQLAELDELLAAAVTSCEPGDELDAELAKLARFRVKLLRGGDPS